MYNAFLFNLFNKFKVAMDVLYPMLVKCHVFGYSMKTLFLLQNSMIQILIFKS